ncbi:isochorismatase [Metarhizium rileyi]|uniref:Isochorismatase n=1 Tax=Metarhizium rileyi (strain RCEF 4871) TaxID=1649241 RepID=A0A166WSE9_METRR|nr:isochorismatase [Metarhizium rileyi RCEF 4871]
MFSFDQALLPQISTRKALILVDFQNEFLDPEGALVSSDPDGFVSRAIELVSNFRGSGDIIWLQSQFAKPVLVDHESIILSDAPTVIRHQRRRSRGRYAAPAMPENPDEPLDPEAFLSHQYPTCVKPLSWGAKMSAAVEAAVQKGDTILLKAQYSGFRETQLLLLLRAKMVMEVYICGSLANVGVYATALDAAGHGMSITVVEDCCGYRNAQRQLAAVRNLIKLTGCEVASSAELVEKLHLKTSPTSFGTKVDVKNAITISSNLVQHMAGLQLDAETPAAGVGNGAAPSPAIKTDSQPAQLKARETAGNEERTEAAGSHSASSDKPVVNGDANLASTFAKATTDKHQEALSSTNKEPRTTTMRSSPPVDPNRNGENIEQKCLCEGETDIIENILSEDLAKHAFEQLRNEIQWQRMLHQGGEVPRLVAVQGEVSDDGSMPVYRHPSDESPPLLPFSPTVLTIKAETEKHLGHQLNHALIQYYRDGRDYISEHSDKTIDVVKGSYIANVSLGAERTMVFRTKREAKDPSLADTSPSGGTRRQSQRAQLPHNSLCRMGLKTNMKWLHSIRQDKRAERDKTPAELAFKGGRISLTFRQIGTFLDKDETIIWGQGATGKSRETANPVINGQSPEAIELLKAFGAENNSSMFDWDARYGHGFDVLHISNSPRFFASADATSNMRIHLMLAEHGINFAKGSMAPDPKSSEAAQLPIRYIDNDASKSVADGDVAIMLYLDAAYGPDKQSRPDLALRFSKFQRALSLGEAWKHHDKSTPLSKILRRELDTWGEFAANTMEVDMADVRPSIADFAVWPVLHAMVEQYGAEVFDGIGALKEYYERFRERAATKKVVG